LKVDFSRLHRLFYPQVPTILSARSATRVSAMPVVSYASVSTSPPLLVVACDPDAFTLRLALASKAFSLSLLGRHQIPAMERLATTSGRDVADKLSDAGLGYTAGVKLDVPVIRGAEATLECQLHSKRRLGDHVLLVGLVKACYASSKFGDFWDFKAYRPVLYTGWQGGMTTYKGS
jgi:flavin reductase (DIM6/NTAB) family NADH-FMN oxidoreductase RutF